MSHSQEERRWRGESRSLSRRELEAFLAKPWVARLATLGDDGAPYISTLWYEYEPPVFYLVGRAKSQWVRNLLRDNRVALHVADDDPPHTRVLVRGKAEILGGPTAIQGKWVELATRMATKYLGTRGREYLIPTMNRKRYWIRVRPNKVITWTGIEWHPKYTSA
jgi:PPOX class probable F420-dependent enzyme